MTRTDPIPRADGSSADVVGKVPDARRDRWGVVERLPDRDPEALGAWEEACPVPGAHITVVASGPSGVTVLPKMGRCSS